MNRIRLSLLLLASSIVSGFAGSAEVHLYSLSVKFQPATAMSQALAYRLELSSGSPADPVLNGELAPLAAGSPSSHGSFYRLTGDVLFEPVFGNFFLNVPAASDADTNGVPDFFEVAKAAPAVATVGTSEDLERGTGRVTVNWSRALNATNGTAQLTMEAYNLTFNHTFLLQQFAGRLNYGSTETNVTGSVVLTNLANPSQKWSGPLNLDKVSTNEFSLKAGSWQTEDGRTLVFQASETLMRKGASHYVAGLSFRDGDPTTPTEDYVIWLIRVYDPNDSDRNGVPDIADLPLPRQPTIGIRLETTNLVLSVSGDLGKRHTVEQIFSLNQTNWNSIASLVLTNDPQLVPLPIPTNRLAFWRVRLE